MLSLQRTEADLGEFGSKAPSEAPETTHHEQLSLKSARSALSSRQLGSREENSGLTPSCPQ